MNTNTKETTKTITENFMILTEDQDIGANKVLIKNLTQVEFEAGGNNNGTVNFPNPDMDWPVSLQDIFDTKLDNSGVIGTFTPGNTPLQGIVLSDRAGKTLVKIGDAIAPGKPTSATTINDKCIQLGGPNSGRSDTSASIFISRGAPFPDNELCIVGMTTGGVFETSRISIWAGAGCNMYGPLNLNGALTVSGALNLSSKLTVTAGGLGITAGGLTVTAGGLVVSAGGLTVSAGTAIFTGGTSTTTLSASGETTVTNINFNNILRGVGDSNIHLVGGGDTYIMARGNVRIHKETGAAHWKNPSGNLVVDNNLTVSGTLTCEGKATFNNAEISIPNTLNVGNIGVTWSITGKGPIHTDNIVTALGGISTKGGNILCEAGKINVNYVETNRIETGVLNVSGVSTLSSTLTVAGEIGVAATIRRTRGNGQNFHLVSDNAMYLMAKNEVIVYKCTSDCPTWDNSSGNLKVEGNLNVMGAITGNFLGIGQKWHTYAINVDRKFDDTYTNSTGSPIQVLITVTGEESSSTNLFIDGVRIGWVWCWSARTYVHAPISAIIPNGSTYQLVMIGGWGGLNAWSELRNAK